LDFRFGCRRGRLGLGSRRSGSGNGLGSRGRRGDDGTSRSHRFRRDWSSLATLKENISDSPNDQ
jgi:hypothetical protein